MSFCAYYGGKVLLALAATNFTLTWTHSVEHFGWSEHWQVQGQQFSEVEGKVQGSGAGIDPPDNAKLVGDWYVWKPDPPLSVPNLNLAVSGFTPSAWKLCTLDGPNPQCYELDLKGARSQKEKPHSVGQHISVPPEKYDNIHIVPGQCKSQ